MYAQLETLPKVNISHPNPKDEKSPTLYKNIATSSLIDNQTHIIPDDDEEDEDEEDDKIVDKSPNGRFQKRNQKFLRHVPGVDNAFIAIEPKSGKEVIWNEIILLRKRTDLENRLLSIIKMLKRNYHPFLVRFLDAWITKPGPSDATRRLIFITERLDEGTLKQFMCNSHSSNRLWKRHIGQLMSVLLYFAKLGVNHGNLTNETIYYQSSGSIKIGIFAVDSFFNPKAVRNISESNRTRAFYLAPEYSDPNAKITSAADIYALGIIALEIAVSEPVFDEKRNNPRQTKLERIQQMLTMVKQSDQYDFIQACLRTRAGDRPVLHELFSHPAMIEVPSLKLFSAKSVVKSIRSEVEEAQTSLGEVSQSPIFNSLLREITSNLEDETTILVVDFEGDKKHYSRYWKDFRSNFTITAKYLEDVRNGYYPFFGCQSSNNSESRIKSNRYLTPTAFDVNNSIAERPSRHKKTSSVSQCNSHKKSSGFRSLRTSTDVSNSPQLLSPIFSTSTVVSSNESNATLSGRSSLLCFEPVQPSIADRNYSQSTTETSSKTKSVSRSFSTVILPSQILLNDDVSEYVSESGSDIKKKKSNFKRNNRKYSSIFEYSTVADEPVKKYNRSGSLKDPQIQHQLPVNRSNQCLLDLTDCSNLDRENDNIFLQDTISSPTGHCDIENCRTCYPIITSEDSSEFDDSSSNLHRNESMNTLGLDDEEEDEDDAELTQNLDYLVPQTVHVSAPVPPAIPGLHRAVFSHCQYSYLGCGRWQVDLQMWFVQQRLNREGCVQLYSHEWHDIEYVADIFSVPSSLHPDDRRVLLKLLDYARHNYPLINGEIQPPNPIKGSSFISQQYSHKDRAESDDEYSHFPREDNVYSRVRSSLDCYDLARRLNAVQLSEDKTSYVCNYVQNQSDCRSTSNSSSGNSIINCFNKEFDLQYSPDALSSCSIVAESRNDSAIYSSCTTQNEIIGKSLDTKTKIFVSQTSRDRNTTITQCDEGTSKSCNRKLSYQSSINSTLSSHSSCIIPSEMEYLAPPNNPMCANCDRHDYLHKSDLPAYLTSPCYHCRERLATEANISPETLLDLHLQHHVPWPAFFQARFGIPPDSRSPQEILNYECKWRSRRPCLCYGNFDVPTSNDKVTIPIIFPPCVEFPWLYDHKLESENIKSNTTEDPVKSDISRNQGELESNDPVDVSSHMIDHILHPDHLPCQKRHTKGAPMICSHGYHIPVLPQSNLNRRPTRW